MQTYAHKRARKKLKLLGGEIGGAKKKERAIRTDSREWGRVRWDKQLWEDKTIRERKEFCQDTQFLKNRVWGARKGSRESKYIFGTAAVRSALFGWWVAKNHYDGPGGTNVDFC